MDKIFIIKEKLNVSRTIRISERLYNQISDLAEREDITINKVINLLLEYAISNADLTQEENTEA